MVDRADALTSIAPAFSNEGARIDTVVGNGCEAGMDSQSQKSGRQTAQCAGGDASLIACRPCSGRIQVESIPPRAKQRSAHTCITYYTPQSTPITILVQQKLSTFANRRHSLPRPTAGPASGPGRYSRRIRILSPGRPRTGRRPCPCDCAGAR